MARKKKFQMPTAFSIILILLILLGVMTYVLPEGNTCYVMDGLDKAICQKEVEGEDVYFEEGVGNNKIPEDYVVEGATDWSTIESDATESYLVDGSGVKAASLSTILMSPILGFENAIDVAIFIMGTNPFLTAHSTK